MILWRAADAIMLWARRGRDAEAIARNPRIDELADDAKWCRFKKIFKKFHIGHLSCNPVVGPAGRMIYAAAGHRGGNQDTSASFGKACHPF